MEFCKKFLERLKEKRRSPKVLEAVSTIVRAVYPLETDEANQAYAREWVDQRTQWLRNIVSGAGPVEQGDEVLIVTIVPPTFCFAEILLFVSFPLHKKKRDKN